MLIIWISSNLDNEIIFEIWKKLFRKEKDTEFWRNLRLILILILQITKCHLGILKDAEFKFSSFCS